MGNTVSYVLSLKDLFSQKMREAQGETEKLDQKFNKLEGTIAKVGTAAVAYLSFNAIKGFVSDVVSVGSEFERAEIGLTTLLKSGEKAKEVFANIKQDAATTPFDVTSLLKGNSLLISAGVSAEQARKDVLNLGNAVAATGGGSDELQRMLANLQQIKNTGKATAMDIKQFAFAGINIYGLLADATGKSTAEVKEMDVSYELLTYAFEKAAKAGGIYANGLENLSKSTSVQLSNVGDQILFLKDDLFQYLKPAIDATLASAFSFIHVLRHGITWMKEHSAEVKTAAVFIGTLAVGWGIYTGYVNAARIATAAYTAAQWLLNIALTANPIGLVITAVAGLAAGIYYAYQKSEEFRAVILGVWEVIKSVASAWWDFQVAMHRPWDLEGMKKAIMGVVNMDLSGAYERGYGLSKQKDYFDKKKESKIASAASSTKGSLAPSMPGMPPSVASATPKADKATNGKPSIINITIGKFQDSINLYTTNLKEAPGKIAEEVNKLLLGAVNDVNRIAGA